MGDDTKENKIAFSSIEDIKRILPKINDVLLKRLKSNPKLTSLLMLIIGVLNRTYELAETAIWSIDNNRPISTAFIIRGLYETLGYITNLEMKLSKVSKSDEAVKIIDEALVGNRDPKDPHNQPNILTCLDKASKMFPQLRENYDIISEVVHPNSASHLTPIHSESEKNREASLVIPRYEFKGNDKKAFINQAGECCYHIIEICERLIKVS